MPDRQPEGRRNTWTLTIVAVVLALAFGAYYLAYGFGTFTTPTGQEAAEDAPTTDQPIDDFAADEPEGADTAETAPDQPAAAD